MKRHEKQLAVEPEDEKVFLTTVREFIRDNVEMDATEKRAIRALKPGDSPIIFGGGAAPFFKVWSPSRRERQFKHVLASELAAGKSKKVATRIAAATVNKARAKAAKKGDPKLVGDGGSRRQWYPGKEKRS